jgi:CheY-like chemotaxis protein
MIPIIAVTASTLAEDQGDLEQKFNAHLRKPFSKHELFTEVSHFLPRRAKPSVPPEADRIVSATGLGPAAPAPPPPELSAELNRLIAEEWPAIRDNLAINETKVFAGKLETLAKRWMCPALCDYAQALAHHADVYEVVELEARVNQFPDFVKRLSGLVPEQTN